MTVGELMRRLGNCPPEALVEAFDSHAGQPELVTRIIYSPPIRGTDEKPTVRIETD